jgi:hypothetical protein
MLFWNDLLKRVRGVNNTNDIPVAEACKLSN